MTALLLIFATSTSSTAAVCRWHHCCWHGKQESNRHNARALSRSIQEPWDKLSRLLHVSCSRSPTCFCGWDFNHNRVQQAIFHSASNPLILATTRICAIIKCERMCVREVRRGHKGHLQLLFSSTQEGSS